MRILERRTEPATPEEHENDLRYVLLSLYDTDTTKGGGLLGVIMALEALIAEHDEKSVMSDRLITFIESPQSPTLWNPYVRAWINKGSDQDDQDWSLYAPPDHAFSPSSANHKRTIEEMYRLYDITENMKIRLFFTVGDKHVAHIRSDVIDLKEWEQLLWHAVQQNKLSPEVCRTQHVPIPHDSSELEAILRPYITGNTKDNAGGMYAVNMLIRWRLLVYNRLNGPGLYLLPGIYKLAVLMAILQQATFDADICNAPILDDPVRKDYRLQRRELRGLYTRAHNILSQLVKPEKWKYRYIVHIYNQKELPQLAEKT
jgi:hypothetical protein